MSFIGRQNSASPIFVAVTILDDLLNVSELGLLIYTLRVKYLACVRITVMYEWKVIMVLEHSPGSGNQ